MPRTLILLAKAPDPATAAAAMAGKIPRPEYLILAEALGAELVDLGDVKASTHPLVRLAAKRGPLWGLAMLGAVRRNEFDHIYVTGEDVGIPLAMIFKAIRHHAKITVVIHNPGTPKRRLIFRALGHKVWRHLICFSDRQRDLLVKEIGLPADKVHRIEYWTDDAFYRAPEGQGGPGEYVFACGKEQRDYSVLEKAAANLPSYSFRVVASGWARHAGFDPAKIDATSNVRVERGLEYEALREAYSRARLVAVPVKNLTWCAGLTSICEAYAMGKPVVATASDGWKEYVQHGVTGLLVPTGDAVAFERAIRELWEDPARCQEMGRKGRAFVEKFVSTDRYVARVCRLLGVTPQRSTKPGLFRALEAMD